MRQCGIVVRALDQDLGSNLFSTWDWFCTSSSLSVHPFSQRYHFRDKLKAYSHIRLLEKRHIHLKSKCKASMHSFYCTIITKAVVGSPFFWKGFRVRVIVTFHVSQAKCKCQQSFQVNELLCISNQGMPYIYINYLHTTDSLWKLFYGIALVKIAQLKS